MPQEKEKKKRKNIEFNCFVFKSEYSIRSLLHWGFTGLAFALSSRGGDEKKRKSIEFNYNLLKPEYPIQSLYLTVAYALLSS
jgi:hypothetical protein